jgi:hypothetical protein
MSSSESDDIESDADRICRNDNRITQVDIDDWHDAIEILDALENNTVVKNIEISNIDYLLPEHQEALVKLSEVMKCNKAAESLIIHLPGGEMHKERIQLFGPSKSWPFTTHLATCL